MEPYQIILLIVLLIAFIYVSLLLYVLTNVREFARRLKKRTKAISIILSEQCELYVSLGSILEDQGIDLGEAAATLSELEELGFDKPTFENNLVAARLVKTVSSRLNYVLQKNQTLPEDPRITLYLDTLSDLDRNFRQATALYNADVAGFNYWISVPTTKWFVWLFGFRKQDLVS